MEFSVVIIGAGPAGSAAGRLLASWGHSVLLLDNSDAAFARARGLAESLPPSARKVLAQTDLIDAVEQAGFYRSTGNTVCWGSERRVETFGGALGFQVFRPDFDRLLLETARTSGVVVRAGAQAREVECSDAGVTVQCRVDGVAEVIRAAWVLDCSGRAGVVARRHRLPGLRTYALVGEWTTARSWHLPDPTHTVVEAYADGWSWSIPISASARQSGTMIDGPSPLRDGRALADAYHAEIEKSAVMRDAMRGATIGRVWACDASTYSSARFGGRRWLLVGDAASFVDPLSSAGVKKALASAWLAAVVVNTSLLHPERADAALDFFSDWERDVCATHARRSREFALEAVARHPTAFWLRRAEPADAHRGAAAKRRPAVNAASVNAALETIRGCDRLELSLDERVGFEPRPVVRAREIVLEQALVVPGAGPRDGSTEATRFVENVDVVALARLAGSHRSVPDLFEAYCQTHGPAPLPNVLGGLSWLVAAGILRQRNAVPC